MIELSISGHIVAMSAWEFALCIGGSLLVGGFVGVFAHALAAAAHRGEQ